MSRLDIRRYCIQLFNVGNIRHIRFWTHGNQTKCVDCKHLEKNNYIDGLVQDYRNSSALAVQSKTITETTQSRFITLCRSLILTVLPISVRAASLIQSNHKIVPVEGPWKIWVNTWMRKNGWHNSNKTKHSKAEYIFLRCLLYNTI